MKIFYDGYILNTKFDNSCLLKLNISVSLLVYEIMINDNKPILFYDGVCNFCKAIASFIIKYDKNKVIQLQALPIIGKSKGFILPKNEESYNSVILKKNGIDFFKSEAIFQLFSSLGGGLKIFLIFRIFPTSFLDKIYDLIANNRYKWFGKSESCRI